MKCQLLFLPILLPMCLPQSYLARLLQLIPVYFPQYSMVLLLYLAQRKLSLPCLCSCCLFILNVLPHPDHSQLFPSFQTSTFISRFVYHCTRNSYPKTQWLEGTFIVLQFLKFQNSDMTYLGPLLQVILQAAIRVTGALVFSQFSSGEGCTSRASLWLFMGSSSSQAVDLTA